MHCNASASADVFIISTLISVLESAPAADVVHEDSLEVGAPGGDVIDHLLEAFATSDIQAALPLVRVCSDDRHRASLRELLDSIQLVKGGILLMLCGHPHVRCGRTVRGGHLVRSHGFGLSRGSGVCRSA